MPISTPTLCTQLSHCRVQTSAAVSTMPELICNNRLLRDLPDSARQRLLPGLELANFARGEVIYGLGEKLCSLHFPTSCVVALICATEDGAIGEMGIIGNDGVAGASQILGGGMRTCCSATVQVGGTALRLKSGAFQDEFHQGGAFQQSILEYIQRFINQVSQIAVCNNLHPLRQRLARRLLMTWDRIRLDSFPMTQDHMALILGVRRASITQIARHFQREGLIRYRRGHVRLLSRRGLEAAACECYRIVKPVPALLLADDRDS